MNFTQFYVKHTLPVLLTTIGTTIIYIFSYRFSVLYISDFTYTMLYTQTSFLFNACHCSSRKNSWRLKYFKISFSARKLKSHIIVSIYIKGVGSNSFCKLPSPSPLHLPLQRKQQYELIFFVYFPISAVSHTHNNDILPFKITTGSYCTFTQITTQLSEGPTVSLQVLWVHCLLLSHQKQSSVNDCQQMIHSVSCCVSVTVCSLLLCPVVCQ